jgi:L-ribulose-5-phosphate 4-epimerase
MNEGIIKFNCKWIKNKPLNSELIKNLNIWRDKLYKLGFIGVNNDGIGYGNISNRFLKNQFIITGSATGKLKTLKNQHYTIVLDFNLKKNSLTAEGPIIASSESLTHAVIYEYDKSVNAVIHIHSKELWSKLINNVPTTDKSVEYGTRDMAKEIILLFKEKNLHEKKILVMAGHEEGIISFGKDLDEAGQVLLKNYN